MVIVGFRSKPELLGVVDCFECPKCLNYSNWELLHISNYFTLFFISIIPTGNNYSLLCPNCNHQLELSKNEFKHYKIKSQLELDFRNGSIDNVEFKLKSSEIDKIIAEDKAIIHQRTQGEIEKWSELVSMKTNDELIVIYFHERYKYNPAMILAVKSEIDKRKISY